jgi:hypothetical protein
MPPSAITRLSTTWTIACSAEALSVLRQTTVRSSANARVTSSNSFDIATVSPLTVAPNINCGHATVQRAREKRGSQQANPISALGAARRQQLHRAGTRSTPRDYPTHARRRYSSTASSRGGARERHAPQWHRFVWLNDRPNCPEFGGAMRLFGGVRIRHSGTVGSSKSLLARSASTRSSGART